MASALANSDEWSFVETDSGHLFDAVVVESQSRAVPRVLSEVRRQKSRIVANWALRVANMPAFRAMPSLRLGDVQRHIPLLLDGALSAMATSDPTMDPEPLARASELASAHGRARLDDEFSIGDLLAEFQALRREVWSALWRVVERNGESMELLRELDGRLSETFDAITIAATEAWVAAPGTGNGL